MTTTQTKQQAHRVPVTSFPLVTDPNHILYHCLFPAGNDDNFNGDDFTLRCLLFFPLCRFHCFYSKCMNVF